MLNTLTTSPSLIPRAAASAVLIRIGSRSLTFAARLAALCSSLSRDFLVSADVAAIGIEAGECMAPAGHHTVRGLPEPMAVFIPDICPEDVGEHCDDGESQGLTLVD